MKKGDGDVGFVHGNNPVLDDSIQKIEHSQVIDNQMTDSGENPAQFNPQQYMKFAMAEQGRKPFAEIDGMSSIVHTE